MAVTRNDVARRAGVSPALVSYVLNNGPRPVSEDARSRIQTAIEELGYRRDGVARYLRTGKTDSLGVVLPDIGLPYYAELTRELNAEAARRGYQLLIATTEWNIEREAAQLESLAGRRVDGMILMSVEPEQTFADLSELGTRVVVIDRPRFAVNSARAATEHLIADGHSRIGLILGGARLTVSNRRKTGWSAALAGAGITEQDDLLVAEAPTRAGGYEAARLLLRRPDAPSAILVESDAQASGLLRAARDLGVSVPGDLAVVALEGTDLARYTVPSLTSVTQPTADIARDAVDRVLGLGVGDVVRVERVEFGLALRESCGH